MGQLALCHWCRFLRAKLPSSCEHARFRIPFSLFSLFFFARIGLKESRKKKREEKSYRLAGTISFYPAKTLGSFGDAGAILTNNKELYDKMRFARDHGRNDEGEFIMWGYNSRMDNLQAAILNYKLAYYGDEINRRREIASIYNENLSSISQIKLPKKPDEDDDYFDVYQNYEICAKHRDQFRNFLSDNGIGTLIQWGGQPVHSLEKLGFKGISLPFTEKFFEDCVMIPMNTSLTDDDVYYVCDIIKQFYKINNGK